MSEVRYTLELVRRQMGTQPRFVIFSMLVLKHAWTQQESSDIVPKGGVQVSKSDCIEAAETILNDRRVEYWLQHGKYPQHLHFDELEFEQGYGEQWLYAARMANLALGWANLSTLEAKLVKSEEHRKHLGGKDGRGRMKKLWREAASLVREAVAAGKTMHLNHTLPLVQEESCTLSSGGDAELGKMVILANGVQMPRFGLGTTMLNKKQGTAAITEALRLGYRLIDTAEAYANEREVGKAIKASGVPREDLFIATKISTITHDVEKLVHKQLRDLQTSYIDLYMIHGPDDYPHAVLKAWRSMEHLYKSGRLRSLGVSNFEPKLLHDFMGRDLTVMPHVVQNKFSVYHEDEMFTRGAAQGSLEYFKSRGVVLMGYCQLDCYPYTIEPLRDVIVAKIAVKHHKTIAQVLLRHALQHGVVVIPKSANGTRLAENMDIFNFSLDGQDRAILSSLPHFIGRASRCRAFDAGFSNEASRIEL